MIQDRVVYKNGKLKIPFENLKQGDNFKLCESNGQVVGDFIAASDAYLNDAKIWSVRVDMPLTKGK